ncbi:MAG: pyrroline-5-carboxylate reductase dimerization domain-containing protein, partial [Oscillospiraceae bacterium]
MDIFGFIGCGNMGGALAIAARKNVSEILLANQTRAKAEALAAQLGCAVVDNEEIAKRATFLFLGVKPQGLAALLTELAPILAARTDRFVLVTMAAGLSIADVGRMAGGDYPILRIMPNTPASIGEGMVLYAAGASVTQGEIDTFLAKMAGAGVFCALPENLIDAGSAISGCGPAFVDVFLEALADGGVCCGLPRAQALLLASQMVAGASKLALAHGGNPAVLKDAV